jgi:anti-sigma regulatory factor (Ser/Thr protein kinase)
MSSSAAAGSAAQSSSTATTSTQASAKIEQIEQSSVHRICSGQVILDLATAVKELVENALDAGATRVDVRCKNYGADCIEVVDNGSGIDAANYESLALKHWTSKLKDFGDLGTSFSQRLPCDLFLYEMIDRARTCHVVATSL